MENWALRFTAYFERPIAERAAKSLANGCQIEIRISSSDGSLIEAMTLTRSAGKNQILTQAPSSPEMIFTLTPQAAEEILNDSSDELGAIGVRIAQLILSTDANRRVKFQLKSGFFTLFSTGYLGVLTAGGTSLASFLAGQGLGGIDSLKKAIKNRKG
jgi:hypothetical protein